jgi:hypothetical protein
MKKLIALLGLTLLFFPSFPQQKDPQVIEFTKKDIERPPAALSQIAGRIDYIRLETRPDVLVGDASRYRCNRIPAGFVVYNFQSDDGILLFGPDGKFKTRIGSVGKGPGQYPQYYKVYYDRYNDRILVESAKQVMIYTPEGKYLESVSIEMGDIQRLNSMLVFDKGHWLIMYEKPLDGELNETGVIKVDHQGKIVKRYDLTDKNSPGCYGYSPQRNYLYTSGEEIYFTYLPFTRTLRLTSSDTWEPAFILKGPIPEPPVELFYRDAMMKQNEFMQQNGTMLALFVYPKLIKVYGATPRMFNLLVDRKSGEIYNWDYSMGYRTIGLTDDLSGGLPFDIRSIDGNNCSVEMKNAQEWIDLKDKLPAITSKDPAAHQAMTDMLKDLQPDDNPVIRVLYLK